VPTPSDLVYVAWFAVLGPLVDYALFWPAFRRRVRADPARARTWLWSWSLIAAWAVVAVGAALWTAAGRTWIAFGLALPAGWRLWTSIGLFALASAYYLLAAASVARSAEIRASVRAQGGGFDAVLPRTRKELALFVAISLTAGFCEEFLFRGYFVQVLAPWTGWWGAAALSLAVFAIGHVYQGWGGVVRTAIFGAIYTLTVAIFGSLWPAIALHALVDVANGVMAWLALREAPPEPETAR
jgi:membrane protease YdiL (CAAX protease family)